MISIKNISSATVVVSAPDVKFRRKLAPGREIGMNQETYDELSFDSGFEHLVKNGFLKVKGVKADEVAVIETKATIAERDDIKKILEDRDITKFAKIIPTASTATKESILALATELRVTDSAFSALIKKYCGVDIIDAIAAQSE